MKSITIRLPDQSIDFLTKDAKNRGVTRAYVLRRLIEEYVEQKTDGK